MEIITLKSVLILWIVVAPSLCFGTVVVVIRTPQEIVAAADSKRIGSTTTGVTSMRLTCKIHRLKNGVYFAMSGYINVVGASYDLIDVVRQSARNQSSIPEMIESAQKAASEALSERLITLRQRDIDYFKKNFQRFRVVQIAIFGVEHETPVAYASRILAYDEIPKIRIAVDEKWNCPGQCDPQGEAYVLGGLFRPPSIKVKVPKEQLITLAESLISFAIEKSPENAGPPISVLRLEAQGAAWVAGKEGLCVK